MRKISFTDTMLEDFLSTYGKKIPNLKRINCEGFVFEECDECYFPDIVYEPGEKGKRVEFDNPGDFECEIYEYALDSKYIDLIYQNLEFTSIIDREEYNDFVNRYHGIKVVRDGFLVQGFGEGDGGDWLVQHFLIPHTLSTRYLRHRRVVVSQQCHRIASFLRLALTKRSSTKYMGIKKTLY